MSEDLQSQFAALVPGGASADEGFEATLEHGEYGFHLNAIALSGQVEPRLHQPPVMPAGRLVGGAAACWRNEGPHVTLLEGKTMIGPRIPYECWRSVGLAINSQFSTEPF